MSYFDILIPGIERGMLEAMPCRTTIFLPNSFYHVFNRGSEKRTIFLSDRDYRNFLKRIKEGLEKYSIDLLSFCLLPNHFHFLLKQKGDASIAKFMNALLLGYAKYFNTKYERVGPLFQGRFKAKMVETDEYLLQVSKYIHRNPISNSVLSNSGNHIDSRNLRDLIGSYWYSSYTNYLGVRKRPFVESETILNYFSKTNSKSSYKNFVEETEADLESLGSLILDD